MKKIKECNDCHQSLPLEAFWKCRTNSDGLQYKCKTCIRLLHKIRLDKDNDYQRRRYAERGDEIRTRNRDYWNKRKDKKAEHARKHYANNREQRKAECRARYAANKERYLENVRKWRAANPDKASAIAHNRRAREMGAEGIHTADEWADKKSEYGRRCAYCRRRVKLTKHHVVPLSKGGDNYISNIVPACQSCNSSIGTKTIYPKVRK